MNPPLKLKNLFITKHEDSFKAKPQNNSLRSTWTSIEDQQLISQLDNIESLNWEVIAKDFQYKTATQCKNRWTQIRRPPLMKGSWTKEEDDLLFNWVKTKGPHLWSKCGQIIISRSGKQCRERWYNKLNPEVVVGKWTPEEDLKIFQLYISQGSKWAKIIEEFPGRTENSIKNRFYSTLRRIATKKCNLKSKKIACFKVSELLKYLPQVSEELERKFPMKRKGRRYKYEDLCISSTECFEFIAITAYRNEVNNNNILYAPNMINGVMNKLLFVQNIVSPKIQYNLYFNPNNYAYYQHVTPIANPDLNHYANANYHFGYNPNYNYNHNSTVSSFYELPLDYNQTGYHLGKVENNDNKIG